MRLYSKKGNDYGWRVKKRWKNKFPDVSLQEPDQPLHSIAKNCRLFISTYNATTYNEALAANIPTVMYWDRNLWEWASFAEKDFLSLKAAGIFHDTPEAAANHVNAIWDQVSDWWYSKKVQNAREKFCRKYSRLEKGMEVRLAQSLIEAARQ